MSILRPLGCTGKRTASTTVALGVLATAAAVVLTLFGEHGEPKLSSFDNGEKAVDVKKYSPSAQSATKPDKKVKTQISFPSSTEKLACSAPLDREDLIWAEECGRIYLNVVLGIRLYATSVSDRTVAIRACPQSVNNCHSVESNLTLWGRIQGYDLNGETQYIRVVDIIPVPGKCEWTLELDDIEGDIPGSVKLEVLPLWHNGIQVGRTMGSGTGPRECTAKPGTRYDSVGFTRRNNPVLKLSKDTRHDELYANFGRQTRWLSCCTWCAIHSKCRYWTEESPKNGSPLSHKCYMLETPGAGPVKPPSNSSSTYTSGAVKQPNTRVKYLGGLSAVREFSKNSAPPKLCRDVAMLQGFPIELQKSSYHNDISPPRSRCVHAGPDVNKGGWWERLPPAVVKKCHNNRIVSEDKDTLRSSVSFGERRCTYPGYPDPGCIVVDGEKEPSACTFSGWGYASYMKSIDVPMPPHLQWQPIGCTFDVFDTARADQLLAKQGISDILFFGSSHLAYDLHLRYGWEVSSSSRSVKQCSHRNDTFTRDIRERPCLHTLQLPTLATLPRTLAEHANNVASLHGSGRIAIVVGPGEPGSADMRLLHGVHSVDALRALANDTAINIQNMHSAGSIARDTLFIWDSGPALHEVVFNMFDTQPLRAMIDSVLGVALTKSGWHYLDSMTPTLSRPDYRM